MSCGGCHSFNFAPHSRSYKKRDVFLKSAQCVWQPNHDEFREDERTQFTLKDYSLKKYPPTRIAHQDFKTVETMPRLGDDAFQFPNDLISELL